MAQNSERVTHKKTNLTNIKIIIAFMIGVILASSIAVYAATYYAKDISYTRQGTEVSNVQEALNDLYTNKKAQNIEGYYQFVKGNNDFSVIEGEAEFSSLGVIPKTYEVTDDKSRENAQYREYVVLEKELDTPISLTNKFELSSSFFVNNSNNKYGGHICFILYQKNGNGYNEVGRMVYADDWENYPKNWTLGKINDTSINTPDSYNTAWESSNPGGRYALIGDGSKIYLYRGNILLNSTNCSLEGITQIDKLEIQFIKQKSTNFLPMPMIVEDVYIGKPLFYKSIVGE